MSDLATIPTNPLMPVTFSDAMKLAELMSSGRLVPAHLQGSPGDCLMVIEQAMRWKMSPFAVAQCTSVIKGKMMFEGKLVGAALSGSGILAGRLTMEFKGVGPAREITLSGTLRGETEPRSITVKLSDARTTNEWWSKQPDQQLVYSANRAWARRHAPEVMLGVYVPEEFPANQSDNFTGPTVDGTAEQVDAATTSQQDHDTKKLTTSEWLTVLEGRLKAAATADEVVAIHIEMNVAPMAAWLEGTRWSVQLTEILSASDARMQGIQKAQSQVTKEPAMGKQTNLAMQGPTENGGRAEGIAGLTSHAQGHQSQPFPGDIPSGQTLSTFDQPLVDQHGELQERDGTHDTFTDPVEWARRYANLVAAERDPAARATLAEYNADALQEAMGHPMVKTIIARATEAPPAQQDEPGGFTAIPIPQAGGRTMWGQYTKAISTTIVSISAADLPDWIEAQRETMLTAGMPRAQLLLLVKAIVGACHAATVPAPAWVNRMVASASDAKPVEAANVQQPAEPEPPAHDGYGEQDAGQGEPSGPTWDAPADANPPGDKDEQDAQYFLQQIAEKKMEGLRSVQLLTENPAFAAGMRGLRARRLQLFTAVDRQLGIALGTIKEDS